MSQRAFEDWTYQGFGYGGILARRIDFGVYHLIDFVNWEETTGEKDHLKYCVELHLMDVLQADPRTLRDAIKTASSDYFDEAEGEERMKMCADALLSCGCRGRLGIWTGNNGHELLRAAKRESKHLEKDKDAVEGKLDEQANAIGNTWRDFMRGTVGFRASRDELDRQPRGILKEYVQLLEEKLKKKEAEIQELKNSQQNSHLEAHVVTRLVQPRDSMRQ